MEHIRGFLYECLNDKCAAIRIIVGVVNQASNIPVDKKKLVKWWKNSGVCFQCGQTIPSSNSS